MAGKVGGIVSGEVGGNGSYPDAVAIDQPSQGFELRIASGIIVAGGFAQQAALPCEWHNRPTKTIVSKTGDKDARGRIKRGK